MSEWLNLLLRWTHLIAGISWIGSSFYFMWLDSHLEEPKNSEGNVIGSLWMVHSGGFYRVEKTHLSKDQVPPNLHWFKWEAAFTWLSGFALLILVYYLGGILIDPSTSSLSEGAAVGMGIGLILLSWIVYDLLWISPLTKDPRIGTCISFLLLVVLVYFVTHIFAGRAAYIHVGAVLGTLMVANVWMRILPAQREMIKAAQSGKQRDATLGKRAKMRSVHNNYMTFPVLFIMLSSHYPSTYGHEQNWLVLLTLILSSSGVRYYLNTKKHLWLVALAAFAFVALIYYTT